MAQAPLSRSQPLIHRLFNEGAAMSLSDAQLAERFVATGDHDAFAVLVARHGAMVMAVCRGSLGPSGDADDAFQATFLVLLNRLGGFPVGTSLGGWLRRVARRVARQARRSRDRRLRREAVASSRVGSSPACDSGRSEIIGLIRQEIDLLPERYRAPIVLCDLEGLSRDEAAELLGCPPGTVGGRLARARKRLRERLERRGVEPSLAPLTASTVVWRTSLDAAVRSASALAAGAAPTLAVLALAAQAAALAASVPVKATAALVVAAFLAGGMFAVGRAPEPSQAVPPKRTGAAPIPKPAPTPDPNDPKLAGRFVGQVSDSDGRPLAGTRLIMTSRVRALSGFDGRFEFDAPDMTYTELDGLPARRQGLLIAAADGLAPDWVVTWGKPPGSFQGHSAPIKGADISLQLARDDVPIHGRLLDAHGEPLAGARVRLTGLKVPWNRDLDAHLDKFSRPMSQFLMFDYARSLGTPQALPGIVGEVFTDRDGRFTISNLGRDWLVDLYVTAPSVADASLTVMTRDAPDVVIDRDPQGFPSRAVLGAGFTLRLKQGRTVTGVVRDREAHQPIAGVWMTGPRSRTLADRRDGSHPITTDADGRFTITGFDPQYPKAEIMAVPPPGSPYIMARAVVAGMSEAVVECPRGIPFRLKLVDEAGAPVDAEVSYDVVTPNPHLKGLELGADYRSGFLPFGFQNLNRAARRAEGVYEGFVIPGPGAVLVKSSGPPAYRPAHVDPKAFFAPGKTDWTPQELVSSYGTHDTLSISFASYNQHDYAAIVLVNPPVGSEPLQLSAILARDKPREVTILDPEGRPVVGVKTEGLTYHPYDNEARLRAATFPIRGLCPDRSRRITFVKEDRELIGFLIARGDGDAPYTVRLQPWATLTGRIVNSNGGPLSTSGPPGKQEAPADLADLGGSSTLPGRDDPGLGGLPAVRTDDDGRFRIEGLVPGQRYGAGIHRNFAPRGIAFKDIVLKPGEVRDLGDIRMKD